MPASRFLIPGTSVPSVQPAFGIGGAGWDTTANAARGVLVPSSSPSNTAFSVSNTKGSGVNPNNALTIQMQYSLPFAGTTGGTVKGQARANEIANSNNVCAQCRILILNSTGTTLKGTLLAVNNGVLSSEFALALTNRRFPRVAGSAIAAVSYVAGDLLIVEWGIRVHSTSVANMPIDLGDLTATADLAENETQTTQGRPWIEFTHDFFTNPGATEVERSASVDAFGIIATGAILVFERSVHVGAPKNRLTADQASFETSSTGWTATGAVGFTDVGRVADSAPFAHGGFAYEVQEDTAVAGAARGIRALSPPVALPGEVWSVSAEGKAMGASPGSIQVRARYLDAASAQLVLHVGSAVSLIQDQYVQATFTLPAAPANTAFVEAQVVYLASGVADRRCRFDKIQLERNGSATTWALPGDPTATIATTGEVVAQSAAFKVSGLVATAVFADQIDLTWDVLTYDGGGYGGYGGGYVSGYDYDIERNGTVIVEDHTTNSYSDTGLEASTLYEYRVRAVR